MTTDTTPRSADAPMRLLGLINANWMAQAPHAATRMLCIDCAARNFMSSRQ